MQNPDKTELACNFFQQARQAQGRTADAGTGVRARSASHRFAPFSHSPFPTRSLAHVWSLCTQFKGQPAPPLAAHETNEPTRWIAKSLVVLSSYVVRAFAVDLLGIHHGQFPFRLALKLVVCAGMSLKIGVQQILDVLTETLGHRSHLHTNWAEL